MSAYFFHVQNLRCPKIFGKNPTRRKNKNADQTNRNVIILLYLAILIAVLPAHAQKFPYHTQAFFEQCRHLSDAHHDENSVAFTLDDGCARYIEGYQMGYLVATRLPATCMADSLSLYSSAAQFYHNDPKPSDLPVRYLSEAIQANCVKK